MLSTQVWLDLPEKLTFAVNFFHRSIVTVAEFGRSRQRLQRNPRVWAFLSRLGTPAEFGRSRAARRKEKHKDKESTLLGGDDMYLHDVTYICLLACQY